MALVEKRIVAEGKDTFCRGSEVGCWNKNTTGSAMPLIRALIELAQENAIEKLLEKKTEAPPTLPIRN